MITGNDIETDIHQHHALEICIGAGSPFAVRVNDEIIESDIVIIGKNIRHKIYDGKGQIVILIDAESSDAEALLKHLDHDGFYTPSILRDRDLERIIGKAASFNMSTLNDSDELYELLISRLLDKREAPLGRNGYLSDSLDVINSLDIKRISAAELADRINVSESRLLHLFKSGLGISLRRFLLWQRVRDAVLHIVNGESFSEAAYSAGFSDAAHLTRTFKSMFGINLRDLFHYSSIIQFIFS
jgi:AraC-like DNA-binding protein